MTTATIQTLDTPDGAFTILADDRGSVLASGWTADPATILTRLSERVRPSALTTGRTDAAARTALGDPSSVANSLYVSGRPGVMRRSASQPASCIAVPCCDTATSSITVRSPP